MRRTGRTSREIAAMFRYSRSRFRRVGCSGNNRGFSIEGRGHKGKHGNVDDKPWLVHAKRLAPLREEREQKAREKKWFQCLESYSNGRCGSPSIIDTRYQRQNRNRNVRRKVAWYARVRLLYIRIFKGAGNSPCSPQAHSGAYDVPSTALCIVHACYFPSLLHHHVIYVFFFCFFFSFFWSYSSSGIGRDTKSHFLRVTQRAPFVRWLFFKESWFQNF